MSIAHKPLAEDQDQDEAYAALLERAKAFGIHKPDPVPPDQAWFWTHEWLAGELEALEDIQAGRIYSQESDEEFLAFLDEVAARADARRR
jgi:hypothetical protein